MKINCFFKIIFCVIFCQNQVSAERLSRNLIPKRFSHNQVNKYENITSLDFFYSLSIPIESKHKIDSIITDYGIRIYFDFDIINRTIGEKMVSDYEPPLSYLFKYNDRGNIIEFIANEKAPESSTYKIFYNAKNQVDSIVSIYWYIAETNPQEKTLLRFKYDVNGNLTKRVDSLYFYDHKDWYNEYEENYYYSENKLDSITTKEYNFDFSWWNPALYSFSYDKDNLLSSISHKYFNNFYTNYGWHNDLNIKKNYSSGLLKEEIVEDMPNMSEQFRKYKTEFSYNNNQISYVESYDSIDNQWIYAGRSELEFNTFEEGIYIPPLGYTNPENNDVDFKVFVESLNNCEFPLFNKGLSVAMGYSYDETGKSHLESTLKAYYSPVNFNLVTSNDHLNTTTIMIYPNPTSDGKITIDGLAENDNNRIYIFDIRGELKGTLSTTKINTQIDLSSFPRGIYIINVTNKLGSTSHKVLF